MYKYKPNFLVIGLLLGLLLVVQIYSSIYEKNLVPALNNIQGKTIVIDPGHGGQDIGCTGENNIVEKNITLVVAKELARLLSQEGFNVKLTRDGDYQPGQRFILKSKNTLDERIALAKKNKADIFVSLHINSSSKSNKAGAVVFYNENDTLGNCLAQDIQQELRRIPNMVKRTSHARKYYILNNLEIPGVVVELGYISNARDRGRFSDDQYSQNMASSICAGLIKHINNTHYTDIPISPKLTIQEHKNVYKNRISRVTEVVNTEGETFLGKGFDKRNINKIFTNRILDVPQTIKELNSDIPDGIKVQDINILGSLAMVACSIKDRDCNNIGSEGEWITLSSIAYAIFESPQIQRVRITVNGEQRKTLAKHMDISETISRDTMSITKVAGEIMEGKKSKVAIVIDDFGSSNSSGVKELLGINRPLTFAVMPNMENTHQHAVQAAQEGHEVIVHLPMQPVKGKASWLGPGAITSAMHAEEIRKQVRLDFTGVPYATGFNNHTGSLITSREDLIRPVLEIAKEQGFYVLDSKTCGNSQVIQVAQSLGIASTQRDIFLDDVKTVAQIKKQLEAMANLALANGSAIGIGHVGVGGDKMAQAIEDMIPVIEAKGIEFVYLSELVH